MVIPESDTMGCLFEPSQAESNSIQVSQELYAMLDSGTSAVVVVGETASKV